jgi:hypothetical protein
MKIGFADTFTKSIEKMIRQQTWWYKTYEFFRYDISRFIRNVWRFRKGLSRHYWWDHHGMLMFMEAALTDMSDRLEKDGSEIDSPRLKKVEKMRRAIQLIKNYNKDLYIEMAEKELGKLNLYDWEFETVPDSPDLKRLVDKESEEEKEHNRKVFERAREIGESEWNELWQIFKGQDNKEYQKLKETLTEEQKREEDQYYKWFDGSDLRGWWD